MKPPQLDPVKTELFRPTRRDYNLSPKEIRPRTIRSFLRGYKADLFDQVYLPDVLLIQFVKEYDPGYPISKQSLSNFKVRPFRFRYLPTTKESLDFISFVKKFLPYFDGDELYALSGTWVTYGKILIDVSPR